VFDTCPLKSSTDFTDILLGDKMKSTNSVVVTLIVPPAATLVEVPIISFELKLVKSKLPPSELKTADETSGSSGSWEKEKVKSEVESHSSVLKLIITVGEKEMQGDCPVVPPTQFPQLSRYAFPFGVL
jgi:hypothetical protein